ncbi:MAG TPA: galactose oxidase [Thermoanaerobaculia bacterium]|nr:galactose oxidase [Thermoanaerobaculia bacterium]
MKAAIGVGALLLAACASTAPSVPAPVSGTNPRVKVTETPIEGASGPLSPSEVVGASWSRALTQAIWSNRDSHAALVYRDRLWVLGGWGAGPLGDVWSSADGLSWQMATAEAAWPARKAAAAAVFADRMWLLGGSLGVEVLRDVWSSTDGATWSRAKDAPWSARHNHAAAVFDGKLWVLGGWGDRAKPGEPGDLNDVWSTADGVTWTQVMASAPWSPRNGHSALVYDGRLWVLGGWGKREDGTEGNLADVWSSADGKTWRRESTKAPWAPRNHQAAVVFADRIWVLGGWGVGDLKEGNLNDVWWTKDGKTWRPATGQAEWLPRNGHAAVEFLGRMWILGGWSQFVGGTSVNDLWWAK